jgi:hypothetical protein
MKIVALQASHIKLMTAGSKGNDQCGKRQETPLRACQRQNGLRPFALTHFR